VTESKVTTINMILTTIVSLLIGL